MAHESDYKLTQHTFTLTQTPTTAFFAILHVQQRHRLSASRRRQTRLSSFPPFRQNFELLQIYILQSYPNENY